MFVKVEKVSLLKADERGEAYHFQARASSYFIVIHRKAGTVSGSHYHKGTIESKDPEILYLVEGKVELVVRDLTTKEEQVHTLEGGMKVEIPPNVYHEIRAITDVILLELNVSEEDFQEYETDTVRM